MIPKDLLQWLLGKNKLTSLSKSLDRAEGQDYNAIG